MNKKRLNNQFIIILPQKLGDPVLDSMRFCHQRGVELYITESACGDKYIYANNITKKQQKILTAFGFGFHMGVIHHSISSK